MGDFLSPTSSFYTVRKPTKSQEVYSGFSDGDAIIGLTVIRLLSGFPAKAQEGKGEYV